MRRSRRSRIPRRGGPDERAVRDYRRPGRDRHAAARAARGRAHVRQPRPSGRAGGPGRRRALPGARGVPGASVNAGTEEAEVEYLPEATALAAVTAAVGAAGYAVVEAPPPESPNALDRETAARDREYRALMRQWWFGAGVGAFTRGTS